MLKLSYIKSICIIAIFCLQLSFQPLQAQCINAQLEMTTGAGNPTGNGPSISNQVITYQNNTNNPVGNTFSSFSSPTVTATYSLSNQQYTSISGLSGTYANGMSFGTALNSNPYQLFPNLGILGSSPSTNFSSSPYFPGQGINAGTSGTTPTTTGLNRGLGMLFTTRPLQNAGSALNGKYYYGDLTITFSTAVNRPIINISDFGGNNNTHFFVAELELQGGLTATKLSGDASVTVVGGNTLTASTVTSTNYMDGSFVVNANGITSITFKVYITGKDLSSTWSGTGTGVAAGEFITVDVTIPNLVPVTPIPTTAFKSCPGASYNLTSAYPAKVIGTSYEVHTVSSNPTNSTKIASPQSYSGSGPIYLYAKDSLTGCYSSGALITLDANACPPAFGCNATAFLYKDLPTDVYNLNLTSGSITKTADNLASTTTGGGINAIGFNPIDGYIWGSNNNLNQLSRVNADNSVTNFPIIGGLPTDYSAGTVDNNGIWYGHLNGTTKIMRVDINNTSPTYLQKLGELTLPSAYNIVDFAFNPRDGFLYSITNGRVLLKINRTTGATVTVGTVTGGSPAIANDDYGAVFIDSLGNFYVNANTSGRIYRINTVQNLTSTTSGTVLSTTYLATSPASGNNDGAMCPNVPPCTPPTAPVIASTGFNSCPATTVNLNSYLPTAVSGIEYVWSTNPNYPSSSFHVGSPTAVGAGTYYLYARRLPASSGCYSLASNSITITIYNPCNDCDGDGVPNEEDIDDDNDGVLDRNEQGCGTTGAWTSLSASVYQASISPNLKVRVTFGNISGTGSWSGITPIANFARACNDYTSEYQPITNVNKPGLQFTKSTGSSVGSLLVEYLDASNNPVSLVNPRMHLGGLGGSFGTGSIGSSSWKLLNGKTMTTLSADVVDFGTTTDSIFHKRLFGAGSGVNDCATGEGSGTVMINGAHSSYTFRVKMFGATIDQMIFMFEGCDFLDSDGDGNINSCDTDDDGDGCPTAFEAGASLNKSSSTVTSPYGKNGLSNSIETNDTKTATTIYNNNFATFALDSNIDLCSFADCDNDGVVNDLDIDDDNDGILDVVECAAVVKNGDFTLNNGSGTAIFNTTNTTMFTNWTIVSSGRTAGGVFVRNNGVRIDQNSGTASIEQSIAPCEIGRILKIGVNWNNGTSSSASSVLKVMYAGTEYARITTQNGANTTVGTAVGSITYYNGASGNLQSIFDVLGTSNVLTNWEIYLPSTIPSSGIFKLEGTMGATNGDDFLIDNISLTGCASNTDNDTKCNSCDTDSDGDGCSDAYEGSATNNTGTSTISSPFGFNGLANSLENNDGYSATVNYLSTYSIYATDTTENKCNLPDCDLDGIPNIVDIDDDNDGALDFLEGNCGNKLDFNTTGSNYSAGSLNQTLNTTLSGTTFNFRITGNTSTINTLDEVTTYNTSGGYSNGSDALQVTADAPTGGGAPIFIKVKPNHRISETQFSIYDIDNFDCGLNSAREDDVRIYGWFNGNKIKPLVKYVNPTQATFTIDNSYNSGTEIRALAKQCPSSFISSPGETKGSMDVYFAGGLDSLMIEYYEDNTASSPANPTQRTILLGDIKFCGNFDFDGDGLPNSCDLDSDGDGCPDAAESGASAKKGTTVLPAPYGANGLADTVETTPESGAINYTSTYTVHALNPATSTCKDCDADSIYNFVDVDDDNDGVLDQQEAIAVPCTAGAATILSGNNTTKTNVLGSGSTQFFQVVTSLGSGSFVTNTPTAGTDINYQVNWAATTGSINYQITNLQSIPSQVRAQFDVRLPSLGGTTQANLNKFTLTFDSNLFVVTTIDPSARISGVTNGGRIKTGQQYSTASSLSLTTNPFSFRINSKVGAYLAPSSNTTISYAQEWTAAMNVEVPNFIVNACTGLDVLDSDNDGQPNSCDTDSDNDGCNDGIESSATKIGETVPLAGPYGENGLQNKIETALDNGIVNYTHSYQFALDSNFKSCSDCDNDSIPNFRDIDDDNDGVLDSIEMNCEVFTNGQFNGGNTAFNAPVAGWTSSTGNAGVFSGQYIFNGSNSTPNAVLFNNLSLSAGQVYTLKYDVGRISTGTGNVAVKIDVIDVTSGKIISTATITKNNTSGTTSHNQTFTPISTNNRVRFTDVSSVTASIDIFIDNVSLKHCNTDGDALANSCDVDSDGDGCPDAKESGATTQEIDVLAGPYGNNGLANSIENNDTRFATVNYTHTYSKALDSTNFSCTIVPDTVIVRPSCNTCTDTVCATADDLPSNSGAITYSSCGMVPSGKGTLTLNNPTGCLTFKGNGTQNNDTVRTCIIACKNGVCDTTFILILPPIQPDTIVLKPSCPTCPVTGCATKDDIPLVSPIVYTSCGVTPAGFGSSTLDETGGCVTFTPNGTQSSTDTVRTCVVACENGMCDTTFIVILPPIKPDTIYKKPACPTCAVTACATKDDLPAGAGTITYTTCGLTPLGTGTETLNTSTGCIEYQPNGTQGAIAVKTCIVACKNGVCDTTFIIIEPPVKPDTITIQAACPKCPVSGCATKDDLPAGAGTTTYTSCGLNPSSMGSQTLNTSTGCITFTGNGTQGPLDTVKTCVVACKNGICDTTVILILPPIVPDSVFVKPTCPTCPVVACATMDHVVKDGTTTYSTCGATPSGKGTISTTLNGCLIFVGNGTQGADTVKTCIVGCTNGKCDTTFIFIPPATPPYGPDSIYVTPTCKTCTTPSKCPTADDVPATYTSNIVYSNCAATPSGMGTVNFNTSTGCMTFTPNSSHIDTVKTCVVKCADTTIGTTTITVCDTTYIFIPPAPIPDTITLYVACDTCRVTACATADDILVTSSTTFSTCGAPSNYTIASGPSNKGCYQFKANYPDNIPDTTCVVACNGTVCDTTFVILIPPPVPDSVTKKPACPTCPVTFCATKNDLPPGTGTISYTTCGTPTEYSASAINTTTGCITFTGNGMQDNVIDKTCIVACKNGVCDTTYIFIEPPVKPDTVIKHLKCATCKDSVCATKDDLPAGTGSTTYTSCGLSPSGYGSEAITPSTGCLVFTPNGTTLPLSGVKSCIVACKNGVCDTTYVVYLPPPGPDTAIVYVKCDTCSFTKCPTADDITVTISTTFTTCGTPAGYTLSSGPSSAGCYTFKANYPDNIPDTTCVVACNGTVCDTTFVIIIPPPVPDSVTKKPACPTCPVTFCATKDDLPPGSGTITYSACGTPSEYSASAINTTTGCITFTGNGNQDNVTDKTCIVACKNGVCDTTYIFIEPPVKPDTVYRTPACPTCPVTACATKDDLPSGSGAITYTSCGLTPSGAGSSSLNTTNGCLTYTPNGTQGATTVTTCVVACKNGICDTTYIIINPPVVPDSVYIKPACPTCPAAACATKDDLPAGAGTITYTSCNLMPATMGSQSLNTTTGCITFTGNGTQGPNDTIKTCVVACKNGVCDTTYIFILPPVVPDTVLLKPACPTCPVTACATKDDLPAGSGTTTYTSCGLTPSGTGSTSLNTTTGCLTYTPNGTQGALTVKTCVVACKNGVCDTTYIIIEPPVVPDTVILKPACPTCPVTACATKDDLPAGPGTTTYTSCGLTPSGTGSSSLNTTTGCITYTPNGTQGALTVKTCVVACKNGVCDTTYIIIEPPVVPDSIYLKPACLTCPVSGCATKDDLPAGPGTTTYTSCGVTPSGYGSQTLNTTTGCITFTPNGTLIPITGLKTCVVACKNGVCDTTYIFIERQIKPDSVTITLSCPTCPGIACATMDDVPKISGTTTYTTCGLVSPYNTMGTVYHTLSGCLVFAGNGTQGSTVIKTCIVGCTNGKCDTTFIFINPAVPPYGPDTVTKTPACRTCAISTTCPTADDVPSGYTNITYASCGVASPYSSMGTWSYNSTNGCGVWTPNGTQTDTVITCVRKCADTTINTSGGPVTTTICDTTVLVILPPPVPDSIYLQALCKTCTVKACPTADDITLLSTTTFTQCGTPTGYSLVSGPDAFGCFVYQPNGPNPTLDKTCVVACNGSVCDTTYVFIYPPIEPDTVRVKPDCKTCPVTACATKDDLFGTGPFSYSSCGNPTDFTSTINNTTGCITLTPNGNQDEIADTTCIVACQNGKCDTTFIIIAPVDPKPNPDVNITWVNTAVTGNVSTNDKDIPAGSTYGTPTAVSGNPGSAVPVMNSNGTYSFTSPVPGVFYFMVPITTPTGKVMMVELKITVLDEPATTNPPVANTDIATTKINTPVTLRTLSNDVSGNTGVGSGLNPTTVTVTVNPTNGTFTVNPTTGDITYSPNTGFIGTDTLTYEVTDSLGNVTTAKQIITVLPLAHSNVTAAADDYKYTPFNTPTSGNVLTNDTDPEGNTQTITPQTTSISGKGTLVLNSNGTYTFTPNSTYIGPVNFPYEVCDNGTPVACTKATLYILIGSPDNTTNAVDDDNVTIQNTPVSGEVLTNDYDKEGNTQAFGTFLSQSTGVPVSSGVTVSGKTPAGTPVTNAGTLNWSSTGGYTFTPTSTFIGTMEIPYTVCDNSPVQKCDTAILKITVDPMPDPNQPSTNSIITNNDDNVSYGNPVSGNVSSNDDDPNGDAFNTGAFTFQNQNGTGTPISSGATVSGTDKVGNPVSNAGTLTFAGDGSYTYTPAPGFYGSIKVPYKQCDVVPSPNTACKTAILEIVVNQPKDTSKNLPPFVGDDFAHTTLNVTTIGKWFANDNDPNIDSFKVTGSNKYFKSGVAGTGTTVLTTLTTVKGGTIKLLSDGTFEYTPPLDYVGPDQVEYEICDKSTKTPQPLCADGTIYLLVTSSNQDYSDLDPVKWGFAYNAISPDADGDLQPDYARARWLGSIVDAEYPNNGNSTADADDSKSTDDEDGLVWPSYFSAKEPVDFMVTVNGNTSGDTAYYGLFIDWQSDGIWDYFVNGFAQVSSPVTVPVTVTPPNNYTPGQQAVRLRVSSVPVLISNATGFLPNGETEDYVAAVPLSVNLMLKAAWNNENAKLWLDLNGSKYTNYTIYKSVDGGQFKTISASSELINETIYVTDWNAANTNGNSISYRIKLIDPTGKVTTTNIATLILQNKNGNANLNLFPNPASDLLNIKSNIELTKIELVNNLGQISFETKIDNKKNFSINVKEFAEGVYIFRAYDTEGNVRQQKVVINKY